MEGIPRVPMICPEMKAPDSASLPEQFADRIREYIAVHYQDDPNKFNASFSELSALRAAVARGIPDVETICVMKRYFAQLLMIKSRFPMEEHDPAAVPFSWIDRTSDMPSSITYEDINFELCSVMFNIGAMHAAIAVSETRSELDSVKNAFMHFLWAAWPLKQLRDEMGAKRFSSSADFEDPYLTFHLNVLLAQAYECMLERSMIQCRTPSLIAQIAYHLAEIYKHCRAHLEHSGLDDLVTSSRSREWKSLSTVKGKLYEAIGHFYMAVYEEDKSGDERSHGLKTSYLLVAMECIDSAMKDVRKDKRESLKQAVVYAHDVIKQKTDNAKKENDVVYHERITKKEELAMPKILPQVESTVKPIGFDPCDYSISGEDLFKALLPTNVIKAVSLYSEEKAKFRRNVIDKVEKKDGDLEEYLLSLQLDQVNFDQPMGLQRLPDELLQSSAASSSQPDGLPELLLQFEKVADLSSKAEHKLSDLSNRLKAINDPEMKADEGYTTISKNLDDLTEHHKRARTSNIELQRAIAAHSENLKLLAMPITELTHEVCGKVINA
ncbi:tyrosine-protein phosphatase non-receptor type 23, partial [Aphelenchoides avenae]